MTEADDPDLVCFLVDRKQEEVIAYQCPSNFIGSECILRGEVVNLGHFFEAVDYVPNTFKPAAGIQQGLTLNDGNITGLCLD